MKKTLIILCLLLSTGAFAQYIPNSISPEARPYSAPTHPEHASYAPLAQEQNIIGNAGYVSAQGERPLADIPQAAQISLGEAARELKKQHAQVKKARIVWEN